MRNLIILGIILIVIGITIRYIIKNWTTIKSKFSGVSFTLTKKQKTLLIFAVIIVVALLAGNHVYQYLSSDEVMQPSAQVVKTVVAADTTSLTTTKPAVDSAIIVPAVITTTSEDFFSWGHFNKFILYVFGVLFLIGLYKIVDKAIEHKFPKPAPTAPSGGTTGSTPATGTTAGTAPTTAPSTPKKWYTPLLNMWFIAWALIILLGIIWYFNGRSKPDSLFQGKGVGGIAHVVWDLVFGQSPEDKTRKDTITLKKLSLEELKEQNRHEEVMKTKDNNGKIIDALTGNGGTNTDDGQWYEKKTDQGNGDQNNTNPNAQLQTTPIFQTGLPPPTIPQPGVIAVQ